MNDFGDMITDCGLIDAGFEGQCFTWTNKRVWERLDRILYSDAWLHAFESTKVTHLPRTWSDHAPLLTSVNFSSKLIRLKKFLKWWNWNMFGDIFDKIKQAQKEVAKAETTFDDTPTEATQTELNRCTAVLTHALTLEEDFWRQKAACRWVDQGERNTKFFHSLVKKKRARGTIHSITHNGILLTAREYIATSAAEFFQSLLSDDIDALLDSLDCLERLPTYFCPESLCSAPNMEEIRHAVFDMDPDSAAGPDGFSALFFQHCWDFIQEDVREAVEDFFSGTPMPRSFTATSLILIPKTDSPDTWNDFRPISLCNVTNKIITKLISLRLAKLFPNLIAPSQSGFVQGRLISDNILLAQEQIHSINSRQVQDNVVFKLDMAKAYDRVQWGFLYKVLQKMGFPASWISYVKHCIENCWFTVLINGVPMGFFKSSRGLRQGDPISPLLFVLATDFLSWGLDALFREHEDMYYRNQALRITHLSYADDIIIFSNYEKACLIRLMEFLTLYSKEMRYHCNGGLNISHLAYANDIMIFTNSGKKGLRRIMKLIQHYCVASGQLINKEKSSVIISNNCSNLITQRLQYITEFSIKHLPVTYLGAPLYKGNKKRWEKSTLSHRGRLALIKSTLSIMPIYLLQVLQPPKTVLHHIDQIMARFFWGTYGKNRRMHWVSWDKICQPINKEGLGVRKLNDMVQAFSLKLWWRFRSLSSLWALFMQQKYYGCLFPGAVKLSVHDSAIWKRMCKARQAAQDNIFWILGDGQAYFWKDHWVGGDTLISTFKRDSVGHSSVNFFWPCRGKICRMPIPDSPKDKMKWKPSSNGEFTTSSAWNLIRSSKTTRQLLGNFWCTQLTPTICHCCSSAVESIPHLFITGEQARAVWEHFSKLFHIPLPQTKNPTLLFQYWKLSTQFSQPIHIRSLIPLLIFWFMWTERNNSKYINKGFYAYRLWRGDMEITTKLEFIFPKETIKKAQQVLWVKPQVEWLKLNIDRAAKGETGQARAGGVLRDHLGNAILAYHDYIGDQNSIYAEIFALTRGLELAKEQGITKLWIEMDAQVIINLITSTKAQGHWKLQEMLAKSKNIMKQMHTRITHIYREGNKIADFLANEACNTQTSRILTP
ncbi:hypothetical protein Pfo_009211 [Paulownia fortunei]|nr:hypothetical protein Pfo_009211 [Paulownia fortunei]